MVAPIVVVIEINPKNTRKIRFLFTITQRFSLQIEGRVGEAQGKVKEATGVIVDDKKMRVEGNVQKNVGKAQKGIGDAKEAIKKGE